jgi:ribose 1,5-bisphosphokinase
MSGLWVFVCGASGAGKDSVMAWAAEHLQSSPGIVFARRMVTRAAHAGSDHDAVTPEQFAQLQDAGALAWHWHAHGFAYGIEAPYAQRVQRGDLVVVNGSREHAIAVAGRTDVRLVQIVVDAEEASRRLQRRGRDAPHEVAHRIARNRQFSELRSDCTIVNQNSVADAGRQLLAYLNGLTAEAASPMR